MLTCRWLSSVGAATAGVAFAAIVERADGQIHFVELGAQRGIQQYTMADGMGAGVAAADYDDDGDVDFFVPNAMGVADQLYRNLGGGQFEEIAAAAGVDSLQRHRVALWFDYDGDGRLDLVVGGDCFLTDCTDPAALVLYRQDADGQFEDVTVGSGLFEDIAWHDVRHRGGMAAGDINRDGYLDLIVGLWNGPATLFINNGDGTFGNMSLSSNFQSGYHWQPIMCDVNGDGWTDIYQAVDFYRNLLWINERENVFVNQAETAGLANYMNDMGMTFGDYDNDGDLDIYITNIFGPDAGRNVLFRNDSLGASLSFAEVGQEAGVDNGHWGWGTTFLDADNDGLLDIAETNGFYNVDGPTKFFMNVGGDPVRFADVSSAVGFDDVHWGSALIAFDYDRDGDLDMLETTAEGGPLRLMENWSFGGSPGNYLVVRPRMPAPNTRAIGAFVRVEVGSLRLMRLITAGTSFMGQEPAEAFFGLNEATEVDSIIVEWPDGSQTTLRDIAANQVLTVHPDVGDSIEDKTPSPGDAEGPFESSDSAP